MAKQLNINLAFTADTAAAKQQIQQLQQSLQSISATPITGNFDVVKMQQASKAAQDLSMHLKNATDVNTGKLDLSRFSQSLKTAGQDLKSLSINLMGVGTNGQQAFLNLASSIATAEAPTMRVNAKLREMGTVLKNTIKWQLSSAMIHGFINSIQKATNYVQDLDSSLNNIRIVSGATTEEMAKFAKEANNAAKALSTNTVAYTDAALIYYQQGLGSEEVKERTEATIKMSNVLGESAKEVSSYMTAVWNNFDDGSKSLEYYGDAMAALGAKTASSSAEIAQGLEKFSSIGDTVGLSFEYATAALATVVAETRQSADTVGTAFKTIFSRLQGLKLGDTLEDGTDLNKYSQALNAVGVNIKDSNGNLKEMDSILDELGNKWKTLEQDEKMALAQTVAGTRQYTQLISLMENYDKFKNNVSVAEDSEGTLSIQADIYAQSWEASSARVKAAAEDIYDSLMDEEFFISFNNGLSNVLGFVASFIDGFGGMKGVLMTFSGVLMQVFAKEMPQALSTAGSAFRIWSGKANADMQQVQSENLKMIQSFQDSKKISPFQAQLAGLEAVQKMQEKLVLAGNNLSAAEKAEYQAKIQSIGALSQSVVKLAEEYEAKKKIADLDKKSLSKNISKAVQNSSSIDELRKEIKLLEQKKVAQENISEKIADTPGAGVEKLEKSLAIEEQLKKQIVEKTAALIVEEEKRREILALAQNYQPGDEKERTAIEQLSTALDKLKQDLEDTSVKFGKFTQSNTIIGGLIKTFKELTKEGKQLSKVDFNTLKGSLKSLKSTLKNTLNENEFKKFEAAIESSFEGDEASIQELKNAFNNLDDIDSPEQLMSMFKAFSSVLSSEGEMADQKIQEIKKAMQDLGITDTPALDDMANDFAEVGESAITAGMGINSFKQKGDEMVRGTMTGSEMLTSFSGSLMQCSAVLNSFTSLKDVFSDEDATLIQKIGAVVGFLTSAIFAYTSIQKLATDLTEKDIAVKWVADLVNKITGGSTVALTGAKTGETGAVTANTVAWYANPIMWIALIIVGVIAVLTLLITGIQKLTEWLVKGNKIETENCDTLIEQAKATEELTNATQELSDSVSDLIEEYEALNATGEDNSEAMAKIQDEMPKLINSYRALSDEVGGLYDNEIAALAKAGQLAQLTGDFTDFNKQKQELDTKILDANVKSQKTGSINANTKLAASMQEVQGKVSGTSYKLHVGGAEAGSNRDEGEAIDILSEEMKDFAQNKSETGIDLKISDYSDPLEMVKYYEGMVEARDRMLEEMDEKQLAQSDTFREINEMIQSTAEAYDEAKAQADAYTNAALESITADIGNQEFDSMEEYIAYRDEIVKKAKEEYGIEEDQLDLAFMKNDSMKEYTSSYEMAILAAEKFAGISREEFSEGSSEQRANFTNQFNEILEGLNSDQRAAAMQLLNEVDSLEEFQERFALEMQQKLTDSLSKTTEKITTLMTDSVEDQKFDTDALLADENFIKYLEQENIDKEAFLKESYNNQYNIVSDFYIKTNEMIHNSYEEEKKLQFQKIADMEEEYSAFRALQQDKEALAIANREREKYAIAQAKSEDASLDKEERERQKKIAEDIAKEFEQTYHFSIEMDDAQFRAELNKIMEEIEKLEQEQIKIAIEWDGIDELEQGYQNISNLSKDLSKNINDNGDQYELTAAQAKDWMKMYPELFKTAQKTDEGIIVLDKAVADNFINNQDEMVDANVDAKIEQLNVEKAAMEEKLKQAENDLLLAEDVAQGKFDLENMSLEAVVQAKNSAVEFFKEQGANEVEANRLALEAMGTNEDQYYEYIGSKSENNAQLEIDLHKKKSEAVGNYLDDMITNFKNAYNNIANLFANIGKVLSGEMSFWDLFNYEKKESIDIDIKDIKSEEDNALSFSEFTQDDQQATFKSIYSDITSKTKQRIEDYKKAIGSIDNQILYLTAIRDQDLDSFGETSKSENEKDEKKDVEELIDIQERYHEITKELEYQEKALSKISKAKDRAYGKDKLKLMEEENALLQDQLKNEEDLYKLQLGYLAMDQAEISKHFQGAQFDTESGNITNYSELVAESQKVLNEAKEAYNLSAQTDEDKAILDAAQKAHDDRIAALEQYEETLQEVWEQEEALIDKRNEIIDNQLEAITYEVEINVSVNDTELKRLEFLLSQLDDPIADALDIINTASKAIDTNLSNISETEKGIKDILAQSGATEEQATAYLNGDYSAVANLDFTSSQIQQLEQYTDDIKSYQEAINSSREQIESALMNSFDAYMSEFERHASNAETYANIANTYKNIVDIVGKDRFGISDQMIDELATATKKAADVKIANAKAQKEFADKALADAKIQRDAIQKLHDEAAEGSDEKEAYKKDLEYWDTQVDDLTQKALNAQDKFTSELSNGLQLAAEQFADAIEKAFEKFNDILTGDAFKNFDQLQDAFDKQQKTAERYFDNSEKLYNISKLNRQIQKDLDNTDNIKAKQTLQELQSEILAYQESGVEMSERDLEAFQKKYDLKLAEIALEEAQNAKSQVRMTRDSEGNWGYTYTADENNIAEAEQNYEDKLEENRKWLLEQNNELTQAIIDNRKTMSEALAAINRTDYESDAAYQQALNETSKWYVDQEAYLLGEMDKIVGASIDMYENDYSEYNKWSGMKGQSAIDLMTQLGTTADPTSIYGQMGANANGWLNSFGTVIQQMGYKYQEVANSDGTGYANQLAIALGTAGTDGEGGSGLFGDISNATYNLSQSINQSMEAAGTSITNFSTTVGNAMYGAGGTSEKPTGGAMKGLNDIKVSTQNLKDEAITDFGLISSSVSTWQSNFSPKVSDGNTKVNNLYNSLAALKRDYSTLNPKVDVDKDDTDLTDVETRLAALDGKVVTSTVVVNEVQGTKVETKKETDPPTTPETKKETDPPTTPETKKETDPPKTDPKKETDPPKTETKKETKSIKLVKASEVKQIADRKYVKVGDKWYSKGKMNDTTWNSLVSKKEVAADTYLPSGISYKNSQIDGLDKAHTVLKNYGDSSIGRVEGSQSIYTDFTQKNGFSGSVFYKHSGLYDISPGMSVSYAGDIVYYGGILYAKVKSRSMNNDYRNKIYWIALNNIRRPDGSEWKQGADFGFDTGGYTGEWGNEGRLAMLHQKEIVLNAYDTENFLRAVEIVRELANIIDLNAQAASFGLGNINASAIQNHNQTLEQTVTIHAEFPNATNHNEIEEAFNNLINTASQYANRKIK